MVGGSKALELADQTSKRPQIMVVQSRGGMGNTWNIIGTAREAINWLCGTDIESSDFCIFGTKQ